MHLDKNGKVIFTGPSQVVPEPGVAPVSQPAVDTEIDSMRRGQRFELRLESLAPISVKLAFVSPARKLFALSRFPDFAQSFDRSEFVQMLQDGELVAIEGKATIDRAIAAVGGSAPPEPVAQSNKAPQIKTLSLAEDDESQIPV